MIQQTSRMAYSDIKPELGKRQQEVYELLKESSLIGVNMTNLEISDCLGRAINTITPRIGELREKGLVKESEKRMCKVSGRHAIACTATGNYQSTLF